MKPVEILALVTLAAVWGASFIFFRIVAPVLHPFVTVETRVLLGGLLLLGYALMTRHTVTFFGRPGHFLLLGLLNAVIPFTLIAWASLHLTASFASILNATTPLFAALVAGVWLGERFNPRRRWGFPLGIAGVAVLVGWSPFALTLPVVMAITAVLLATLSYGVAASYAKRQFAGVSGLNMAMGQQFGASALLLVPAALVLPSSVPTPVVMVSLLMLALLSTAVAYVLYFFLIARVGPTKTLSVTYLIPVFGSLWGIVFLNEQLSASMMLGLLLIVLSVILVNDLLPGRRGATVPANR